jgi:hypothetical protein
LALGSVGSDARAVPPADSTQWHPYQVGFPTAAFITILRRADAPERYQVYGRYRVTRDWTLRAAVRYRHLFSEDQEVETSVRTGVDYVVREEGRFQLYGGVDLLTGYDRTLNGDQTFRVGSAPLLGLLFHVTPHLSLSVEPRLVALYSYFDNPAQLPDDDTFSVEVKGEGLLFINVHF